MTKRSKSAPAKDQPKPVRDAVDEFQGIPDCAERQGRWRWVLIAALFAGWVAFLVYCWLAGRLPAS